MGLLSETHTAAYRLLQDAGVEVAELMRHLESILTPGPGRDGTDLRLDPSAKKAIDLAWTQARRLQRNYIGTEHLILGILAADSGATGITFRHFSVDLEKVRHFIDSVDSFYVEAPVASAGSGFAAAARQAEPDRKEPEHLRRELLPGILIGVIFTVIIMMLRGCG
jgi:ATP-dependent Clp protease ATP-binding subunit ClpC